MIRFYKIIILFVMIQMFSSLVVKAQDCNVEPKGWLGINIFYMNTAKEHEAYYNNTNDVSFVINIVNKTNFNLDMPFKWIQTHSIKTKFINMNDPKLNILTLGSPIYNYKEGLLTFTPSTSTTFYQNGYGYALNSMILKRPADILAIINVSTYVYYAGSSEPIGNYKNGKFEPTLFSCTKQFHLKIQ